MIHEYIIDYLKKLSYIDDVVKTGSFYIVIHYDGNKHTKKISRRASPTKIIKLLKKIKKEINYKDEDQQTSEVLSFYIA